MTSEQVGHRTFEGHPYAHLFTISDPPGAVLYRTDSMQQVICSSRGGDLAAAMLAGEGGQEEVPPAVRAVILGAGAASDAPDGRGATAPPDRVHTMYLLPTLDCQLRCNYCRIARAQGHQAGFRLSPELACDAIDRFLGGEPDGARRTVVFFGGEPLLVPETVFAAIRRVREGPGRNDTDIVLQTNAIAIDEETARFLAANEVFVLASIDGPPEVHDRHRRLANGAESYRRSVEGYRRAKACGCRVGISATLTRGTADAFISSFPALLDELEPDEFGIGTHLHPLSGGRSPHQCDPAVAACVLTEAFVLARERGLYFQQMCQRVRPFVSGTRRRYACAACGGKVVVAPNATAGICEYNAPEGRSYVPLDQFAPDKVPDLPRWSARSPLNDGECRSCPALPTCGGGCAYDSQVLFGDALRFDPWLCETNRQIVRWMMQDLLSHLRDRLHGGDFHIVTPQERALLLSRIELDSPRVPMPAVARYGEGA